MSRLYILQRNSHSESHNCDMLYIKNTQKRSEKCNCFGWIALEVFQFRWTRKRAERCHKICQRFVIKQKRIGWTERKDEANYCDTFPCPYCWCLSWHGHGPHRVKRGLSSCHVGICLHMGFQHHSRTYPQNPWFLRKVHYLQSHISSRGKEHLMGCGPTTQLHFQLSRVLESCLFIFIEQNFRKRINCISNTIILGLWQMVFWGESLEDVIKANE